MGSHEETPHNRARKLSARGRAVGRIKQVGMYQIPRVFKPEALLPNAAQTSWLCLLPTPMIQPEGTENLLGMEHQVNSPQEFLLLEFQLIYSGASVLLKGEGGGKG